MSKRIPKRAPPIAYPITYSITNPIAKPNLYASAYASWVRRQVVGEHLAKQWLRSLRKKNFGDTAKYTENAPLSFFKKALMWAYSEVLRPLHIHVRVSRAEWLRYKFCGTGIIFCIGD